MGNTQATNPQYTNVFQQKAPLGNPYLLKSESDAAYQPKGNYYTKTESDAVYQPKGNYILNNADQIIVGNTINPGKINLQAPNNISWVLTPTNSSICFTNSNNPLANFCLSDQGIVPPIVTSGYTYTTDNIILSDRMFDLKLNTDITLKQFSFSAQPVSVSVWVRGTLSKGVIIGNFDAVNAFNLMFSLQKLRIIWQSTIGTVDVSSKFTFSDNVWYHIVMIKNSSTSIQLYINNVLQETITTPSSSGTINLNEYRIGRDRRLPSATPEGIFQGTIYGLLSYSKILSPSEISTIFNYQKTLEGI